MVSGQFYGIMAESRSALGSSIFFFVIAWILDLAGAVCIIVYGVEDSNTLTNQLRRVFLDLIYRMDYDPGASRILKIVQEYVSLAIKATKVCVLCVYKLEGRRPGSACEATSAKAIKKFPLSPRKAIKCGGLLRVYPGGTGVSHTRTTLWSGLSLLSG